MLDFMNRPTSAGRNTAEDASDSHSGHGHGAASTTAASSTRPSHANYSDSLRPDAPTNPPIKRPVSVGNYHSSSSQSRLSHEIQPDDIPDTIENARATRSRKRFSLMRRNYSESHLSARAKMDAERAKVNEELPPVPAVTAEGLVPTIVKTAPTMDDGRPETHRSEDSAQPRPSLFRRGTTKSKTAVSRKSTDGGTRSAKKGTSLKWRRGKTSGLEDLHRLSTMQLNNQHSAPPSYGDESNSALAVPVSQLPDPRVSSSNRSDDSNATSSSDGHIYGSTTTTTHTVSTHTTFFKLPRRNKNRNSLFPLPIKLPPPDADLGEEPGPVTPRASTQSHAPDAQSLASSTEPAPLLRRAQTEASPTKRDHSSSNLTTLNGKASLSFADPSLNLIRQNSRQSEQSAASSPLQPPMRLGPRDRSSTTSSFGGRSHHGVETPPPNTASGRTSTSTTGRASFGGFLNLSRFRNSSEPHSPWHGSPGTYSKSTSFAMSREALVIPEREEGDTPGKYLERLESAVARSVIAGILSKSADPFAQAVLRSYTRRFPFFTEPIDMSLRKFLLEAELPKETQQVDRVIQAFADRYHECNPGIFTASDVAYVIAFSIMMLHTDAFNKNNKRKMQKQDYVKNTSGQGISDDILACFYDNICYTPFIHYDEDVDINGERVLPFSANKKSSKKLKSAIPGADAVAKKPSGPVDPYNLIVEQKLDTLRPAIKDSILMDDPYDYRGSHGELDPQYLQRAFTSTGVIQIISARSRPAAYESQFVNGQPNPTETQQGIVDLKITKVGLLWRKSAKKKKTRSPWQEWGAILTGSQLYLFKNSHWAKGLMHQFNDHQKPGQPRKPVIFKPPLADFKPDALIKTDNAVALVDSTYNRHKNAFTLVRNGGQEEVLLADNEQELHDWLGLINYAAAFRAAGVRIRGMVGGNEDQSQTKEVARLNSSKSVKSIQTRMGETLVQNRGMTPQLQRQVMAARRQIMIQKIAEIEREIETANRQLDNVLRNARHLLVLAPIAPRTREDVVLAAGRADASIKWLRRDMWRMKCHRDILAMDVRIDGLSAAELEKLTQNQLQIEPDSSKKDKPKMLNRFSSSRAAKSPPQSPITGSSPITRGSTDHTDGEGSPTPPSTSNTAGQEGWRLPPLNLSPSQQFEHRPSVASTFLSASPPMGSNMSLQHSHSTSSMFNVRSRSTDPAEETDGRDRTGSVTERELQLLARATMVPDADKSAGRPSIESSQLGTSPESKHRGVRRSLQRTLRDHNPHSHSNRHRRNKESDSTIRSGAQDDKESEEATPGLTREKPRFILHGKQASVVQFGGDWERMRLRREQYGAQHPHHQSELDAAYERQRSDQDELFRAGMTSPVIHDFARDSTTDGDEDTMSILSEGSRSFRSDAEAAAAYTSTRRTSSTGDVSDFPGFDLSDWDPDNGRRTTVIGPSPVGVSKGHPLKHRRFSSLQKGGDGNIEDVEDSAIEASEYTMSPRSAIGLSMSPPQSNSGKNRENRRTVIGPSTSPRSVRTPGSRGKDSGSASDLVTAPRNGMHTRGSTSAGTRGAPTVTEDSTGESSSARSSFVEGENGFVRAISDDELRSMSSSLNGSPQTMRGG